MARAQSPPILLQIKSARSPSEQVVALRALKNDLIGHVQKKEAWVRQGVLEPVVKILSLSRQPTRPNGKETSRSFVPAARPLSVEEDVRLQSLQLLASFANGGPRFLSPLHAAGAVPVILSNLSPLDNPAQVVQATLRALLNLADAAMLAVPPSGLDVSSLADAVFAPQHLESLCLILSSSPLHASSSSPPPSSTEPSESPSLPPVPFSVPTTATLHDQIHLLCGLIGRLCREERHQFQLATCGVLDSLATRLASFVVADGQVLPPASSSAPGSRGSSAAGDGDEPDEADVDDDRLLAELIPEPAPRGLRLGPVLEAIAAIIGDSGFRVSKLVYSPSMLAVFPPRPALPSGDGFWAAPRRALEAAGLSYPRNARATAMDYLLPAVPTHHPRTTSSLMTPFPPLGLSASVDNLSSNGRGTGSSGKQTATGLSLWQSTASESPGAGNGESGGVSVTETALIPWLMTLVRSRDGIERLMAASVLTSLFKADFANESREAALGLLVVPVLLQLLADNAPPSEKASQQVLIDDGTTRRWAIRELTPAVLARLITDSDVLQKAAFDCDAVTLLRSVIKEGYEPVPDSALAELWSPTPAGSATPEPQQPDALSAACRLGPKGLHPLLAHNLRVRESALKAIGALAAFKEEYRKAFVEHDVVGYLVESLSRSPSKPRSNKERAPAGPQKKAGENASPTDAARYGTNPESVIIAACHALRMFSRSVSILRTSLLDFGVAEPIFQLLKHPDVDIQIAATAVVCNLVTEVSPMRQQFNDLGIMPILCEHAHALNASLRLNALWALKHFVQAARNDLKKACLEELESGWLVQLICDDTEDDALYSSRPKGIMSDIMDEDIEMEQSEEQPRSWMAKSHIQLERIPAIREAGAILADLRDVELNPVRKARSDDLAIQEQGLDFIRNLIGSADSSGLDASNDAAEMIDHLLETFGADRLFRILANKLRTKTVPSLPNNGSSSKRIPGGTSAARELRRLYPQAKIIESVIFILVHMAASVPRHRQMVMAQTELLRSLRQHFASRDKEVRVALCHLVGNLTWKDDAADEPYCAGRIRELRDLGFQARLEQLEHDDPELDVRERAKGALCQMRQGSGNGSSGGGAASSSSSGVGVGAGAGVSAATTATF